MTSDNISTLKKEITDALESILESGVDKGILGLSVAICKSSGIVCQSSAGFADIADQSLITSKHIFGIGSISKVFVAVAILQLMDEKLLHVSDTVDKFLEE
jgi:D-alanyl-D-alanine carboxypeptidase